MSRKSEAYETPNGREIRDKRKAAGWSPEQLAKAAHLGTSTVKRAERGLRVQLRNLSKIAGALDVKLAAIAPRLRDSGFSVQVLYRWGREYDLIARAEKSLVIIDSFFSEYGRLASALRERARNSPSQSKQRLNVEVHMASPDYDFGAQRLREMTDLSILRSAKGAALPLSEQLHDSARDNYESYFHLLEEATVNAAKPYTMSVKVFEYRCMPGLRIVAIDGKHYFFGWFPLFAQNPAHTCFYITDENLDGADAALLEEIRTQIENVKAISTPALGKEARPRRNRRKVQRPQ